jgi:predicted nucleotidyltransferase
MDEVNFGDIVRLLVTTGARFVVVGGVAVVLHGHLRFTADIDVVVDPDDPRLRVLLQRLEEAGFVPRLPVPMLDFADVERRRQWVEERGMMVFTVHDPTDAFRSLDLFAEPPLPFEDLWERSVAFDVAGVEVRAASIDDLISMKRAAGRPQDTADVAALERIRDAGA